MLAGPAAQRGSSATACWQGEGRPTRPWERAFCPLLPPLRGHWEGAVSPCQPLGSAAPCKPYCAPRVYGALRKP